MGIEDIKYYRKYYLMKKEWEKLESMNGQDSEQAWEPFLEILAVGLKRKQRRERIAISILVFVAVVGAVIYLFK